MKMQSLAQQRETLQAALEKFVAQRPGKTKGDRKQSACDAIGCRSRTLAYYLAKPRLARNRTRAETWPKFVERKPGMMTPRNLQDFAAAADVSLDHLATGNGAPQPLAAELAGYIREALVAEAQLEVARAKDVVERIEAENRKSFIERTCRYVGENALALLVDIARDDVRALRTFEATFAIEAYARMVRGYSSADNLRSVAANMDRRAAQLMTTVPKETQLVEFVTDPAAAPRARRR